MTKHYADHAVIWTEMQADRGADLEEMIGYFTNRVVGHFAGEAPTTPERIDSTRLIVEEAVRAGFRDVILSAVSKVKKEDERIRREKMYDEIDAKRAAGLLPPPTGRHPGLAAPTERSLWVNDRFGNVPYSKLTAGHMRAWVAYHRAISGDSITVRQQRDFAGILERLKGIAGDKLLTDVGWNGPMP